MGANAIVGACFNHRISAIIYKRQIFFLRFLLIFVLQTSWTYLNETATWFKALRAMMAAKTSGKHLQIYYRLTRELNDPYLPFQRQIRHVYDYEYTFSIV